jgi:hypothetical protein
MLEARGRRGRPKGTGIDDSDRIARLAELLRIHPELRPTTAIRAMGIIDPSIVRRIRDKYKIFSRTTAQLTAGGSPVQQQRPRAVSAPVLLAHRS